MAKFHIVNGEARRCNPAKTGICGITGESADGEDHYDSLEAANEAIAAKAADEFAEQKISVVKRKSPAREILSDMLKGDNPELAEVRRGRDEANERLPGLIDALKDLTEIDSDDYYDQAAGVVDKMENGDYFEKLNAREIYPQIAVVSFARVLYKDFDQLEKLTAQYAKEESSRANKWIKETPALADSEDFKESLREYVSAKALKTYSDMRYAAQSKETVAELQVFARDIGFEDELAKDPEVALVELGQYGVNNPDKVDKAEDSMGDVNLRMARITVRRQELEMLRNYAQGARTKLIDAESSLTASIYQEKI